MNNLEFQKLLFNTMISNKDSDEESSYKLKLIGKWIIENIPSKLYRYRKFDENGYNFNAFKEDEIWGSSISTFNDPCESVPWYDDKKILESLLKGFDVNNIMLPWQMAQNGELKNSLSRMFREEDSQVIERRFQEVDARTYLNSCIDDLKNNFFKNYAEFKRDMDKEFYLNILNVQSLRHVACFSEKNDSSLMWGHYADSHTGFCIEYNFAEVLKWCEKECKNILGCKSFMLNYPIAPVIYSDTRFDATEYMQVILQDYASKKIGCSMKEFYYPDVLTITKSILTKSSDWSYEKEWRLVSEIELKNYISHKMITKLKPKAVYIGAKATKENADKLYQLCQDKHIDCYKMIQSFSNDKFDLQPVDYKFFLDNVKCE